MREIQVFLRRNRIQLIIAVFCMLATIKQMKAPFIFQYNAFTSFLFERIPSENVGGEILDLINNLGFAYYSSLVFYYVVDYFPTRKREKAALKAVGEHLTQISVNIECMFAILMHISGKGSSIRDVRWQKDSVLDLCDIELNVQGIYCNRVLYNKRNNDILERSMGEKIIPFEYVQEACKGVLKEIDMIKNSVKWDQLENEIKDVLAALSNNRYINNITSVDRVIFDKGIRSFTVSCTQYDLLQLIYANIIIGQLPIEVYQCSVHESTEEECQSIVDDWKRLREENPTAAKVFEELNKKE